MALSLTAMPVQAQGVIFVQKETRGSQATTSRTQMDKDHMRSESRSSGDETAFVFDEPKQTARTINITKKTYMEMTKADLEKMRKQMDGAMAQLAQMQQQMQNMPAAQRAMMEQMMQGRGMPGMAAAAPKVDYKQTGSDKVGQWTCTKYEGSVGGQKTTEVCTVDPKEFGLTPADFTVAQQLADFMKTMMPDAADKMVVNGTVQDQGYAGIPVRRTTYKNGAVESTSETTEFRREAIPASAFETPVGFKKDAMPGAGR